jgi:hypothetical protein
MSFLKNNTKLQPAWQEIVDFYLLGYRALDRALSLPVENAEPFPAAQSVYIGWRSVQSKLRRRRMRAAKKRGRACHKAKSTPFALS